MMTKVMMLFAMIAIPSMAKIMVLDDATDLRALLTADALPTEHNNVVNNTMSHTRKTYSGVGTSQLHGPLWSVVCQNTPHGNVPCRVDSYGTAFYPWGGKEFIWRKVSAAITGGLYWDNEPLPEGCKTWGREYNSGSLYAAVIPTRYGSLPGKANKIRTKAWYSWDGKAILVTDRFQVIC